MTPIHVHNANLIEAANRKIDMAIRGLLAMQPDHDPQFEIKVSGGRLSVSGIAGAETAAAKHYLQRAADEATGKNRMIEAIEILPQFPTFHVTA